MKNNLAELAAQQPDMLVSCQEISAPIRPLETAECYQFIYREGTDAFIYGCGQLVAPRGRQYVFWGPKFKDYLVTVRKSVQVSLVVDTLPVGDFEKLTVLKDPRFHVTVEVSVNTPQRLLGRLDKQHLQFSALEFCVKNIKHLREALRDNYRGGNSLSSIWALQNTELGRISRRFGLTLKVVQLSVVDRRNSRPSYRK